MMRPAPDMIGPSWLPLADAIKSEASSVTTWSLPTTQWGAATAYAQAAGSPSGSDIMTFLPMIAIVVVFYFLLIRPQQKRAKETKAMLSSLQKGDEVVFSVHPSAQGLPIALVTKIVRADGKVIVDRAPVN